jgi:hypothetical protein
MSDERDLWCAFVRGFLQTQVAGGRANKFPEACPLQLCLVAEIKQPPARERWRLELLLKTDA